MNIRELLRKPSFLVAFSALIGLALGLLFAYQISPVQWVDASPGLLHEYYQEDYLRMAIDSFQRNGDSTLAIRRYQDLGANGPVIISRIMSNPGTQDPLAIALFAELVRAAPALTGESPAAAETPTAGAAGSSSLTKTLLIGIGILVVAMVGYAIIRYLLPLFRSSGQGDMSPAHQALELSRQTEMTDYAAMGEEPPVAQFMTTYVLGDDLFDDSFSIDAPSGEFMGECGVGISETIGVGEPKKVSAFEVWLFDKNDIQTVTKVLMSARAFSDPATYQRLENKGEPFLVERGKQIVLETMALQLVATVTDVDYGQGALPENSFFDRLTLEIAVWPKIVAPE
ncbi:MAG: hypothetical protein JXB85_07430 [Anaerolineales bacterium]|nr:hypothetical protein [Anaerolineales bacterium]